MPVPNPSLEGLYILFFTPFLLAVLLGVIINFFLKIKSESNKSVQKNSIVIGCLLILILVVICLLIYIDFFNIIF